MKPTPSFQDILAESMARLENTEGEAPAEGREHATNPSTNPLSSLWELLTPPPLNASGSTSKGKAYDKPAPKSVAPAAPRKPQKVETHWAVKDLSLATQISLQALGLKGESVTVRDLKRAFRRQALELHPDRSNNASEFITAQEAYETALKELSQKKAA
jgi:hypothetical protein